MPTAASPFQLPENLPAELAQMKNYWESLKRGDASMPFWDDITLSSLPGLTERLMSVDVFESPHRFRFNTIGQDIRKQYEMNVTGKFLDEIEITVRVYDSTIVCHHREPATLVLCKLFT